MHCTASKKLASWVLANWTTTSGRTTLTRPAATFSNTQTDCTSLPLGCPIFSWHSQPRENSPLIHLRISLQSHPTHSLDCATTTYASISCDSPDLLSSFPLCATVSHFSTEQRIRHCVDHLPGHVAHVPIHVNHRNRSPRLLVNTQDLNTSAMGKMCRTIPMVNFLF